MQQIRQRPQGRDRAGVIAAGRLGVRPRGRDQRLAAVGQLQQQLHHPVPSHPTQHPQRPVMQRMTNSRDRHRRREVLETGSKSGLRSTRFRIPALMDRVRNRIGDKRVLALVKAFLKAGILIEGGAVQESRTGTPQGGILSPVLANVALSVLDEHFARAPGGPAATTYERTKRRRQGLPNCRLVRYADDWCLAVSAPEAHAEAYREEAAEVLSAMGLRLSPEKTASTHIDEGLDFLGWRIQRRRKQGTSKHYVYTYPARKSVASVTTKVKTLCRQNINLPLEVLLHRLNSLLRGWTTYFRPGVSSAAFNYLRAFTWRQVVAWLRRKHSRINGRNSVAASSPAAGGPPSVRSSCSTPPRSPPRGTATAAGKIPSPWPSVAEKRIAPQRACGEPDASTRRTSGSEGGAGKRTGGDGDTAPRADPTTSTCAWSRTSCACW